jgi:hypothetical protein
VKQAVFVQMLECLDVGLGLKERQLLLRLYERNGRVHYADALKALCIAQDG